MRLIVVKYLVMKKHIINEAEIWAYVSKRADKETEDKVKMWINSADFDNELYEKIVKLYNITGQISYEPNLDIEKAKQEFFNKVEFKKPYRLNIFYKYAAVIAMLAVIFTYTYSSFFSSTVMTYETAYSEQKQITLPDGSLVFLNASSKISFNTNYPRAIILEGEAFFEVKKDENHPFTVETSDSVIVKALGTSFNVKSYSNGLYTETTLLTGKVEVTSNKYFNEAILMLPNDKIKIEKKNGVIVRSSSEIDKNTIACQNNKIQFENKTFQDIAYDLSLQHNIKISFTNDKISNSRFTGYFDYETPLNEILEVLKISKNFNYEYKTETDEWIIK